MICTTKCELKTSSNHLLSNHESAPNYLGATYAQTTVLDTKSDAPLQCAKVHIKIRRPPLGVNAVDALLLCSAALLLSLSTVLLLLVLEAQTPEPPEQPVGFVEPGRAGSGRVGRHRSLVQATAPFLKTAPHAQARAPF